MPKPRDERMSNSVLTEQDIEEAINQKDGLKNLIKHVEKDGAHKAVIRSRGNQTTAAKMISVSRSKFSKMI